MQFFISIYYSTLSTGKSDVLRLWIVSKYIYNFFLDNFKATYMQYMKRSE